jgi:hypothetical protein
MIPDDTELKGRGDLLKGVALALPILFWPLVVRSGVGFLAATFVLVLVPLLVARTATQLIVVLFAYYGVDGYLRLVFEYNWAVYQLPLWATMLVYVRWFFGPKWKQARGAFWGNPVSLPLIGLVGLYGLQMLNGVPWNPVVSVGGFVYHLGAMPLFFVAASGFADERQVRRILWFILGLVLLECVYALGQHYLGPSAALTLSQHYQERIRGEAWWTPGSSGLIYRPTGLTISGVGPGMYGLIGIVLVLGLFEGRRLAPGRRLVILIGVFVMLVAVFLSAVRAFWLGLLVAAIVYGVLQSVRHLTVIVGLGCAAAAAGISWTGGALYERLSTLAAPWDVFSRERGWEILRLPDIISQYPMGIGVGRAAGSAAGQARQLLPEGLYGGTHNYWVSITWEASLLAPLLLGWLLWRLSRCGWSILQSAPERSTRGIVAAILALDASVVAMTFAGPTLAGVSSSFAQYFWFLSGLLFAIPGASAHPRSAAVGEHPVTPDAC